jgi:hypothetical protein
MYETRIKTLHVTLGKVEGKMSLDETDSWIQKGGEMTCETDNETVVETLKETDEKRNEKDTLGPVISSESRIITVSSFLPYVQFSCNGSTSLAATMLPFPSWLMHQHPLH